MSGARARANRGHVMGWGRVGGGKAWHSHVCTVARTITEVPKRLITMCIRGAGADGAAGDDEARV